MATTKYEGANSLAYLLTLLKGAFALKAEIPDSTSDLTNDSGFVTSDTTYTISLSSGTVTLSGSDGNSTQFDLPAQLTVDAALDGVSENPVQNKAVNAAIEARPTTEAVNAAIDDAIQDALADISGVSFQIVESSLPETGEAGVFYLMSNSGSAPNVYDEYIWMGTAFERIGSTDVDLSGYMRTTDLVELTNTEVQDIWDQVMGE